MLRNSPLSNILYILYDEKNKTYNIGGGSSTPAKPRIFCDYAETCKYRAKYWPDTVIKTYTLLCN